MSKQILTQLLLVLLASEALVVVVVVSGRLINTAGRNIIKQYEPFIPNVMPNPTATQKVGYGHLCKQRGCTETGYHLPITQAQGDAILTKDLVPIENCVNGLAPNLNDNQFSALVSFTFNVGCDNLKSSALLKLALTKNYSAAANEFGHYVKSNGQVSIDLVKRRMAEKDLFLK